MPLLLPLIILGCVLWWAFVLNLIGWTGGWWALARHHRAPARFEGTRFRMCSGKLGWSNYGSCLTIGVNATGLRLSVPFAFRPGHPPLFIPWSEIEATPTKGWLFRYLDLRFRQVPHLQLRLGHSLGLKIAAAANLSWGENAPAGVGNPDVRAE